MNWHEGCMTWHMFDAITRTGSVLASTVTGALHVRIADVRRYIWPRGIPHNCAYLYGFTEVV